MKISLFKNIGDVGAIAETDLVLDDVLTIAVEGEDDGCISLAGRRYTLRRGKAKIPESEIAEGVPMLISFVSTEGKEFACGVITRSGRRHLRTDQNISACIIACCREVDILRAENKRIDADIRKIKTQYGVSIV